MLIDVTDPDDLTLRLLHVAAIYDDGHDDLGSSGLVIRSLLAGKSVEDALWLDLDDPFAKARFERTKP